MPERNAASTAATISAMREGAPADLSLAIRTLCVPADDLKVEIRHRGSYEHFERAGHFRPEDVTVVFRWITRTNIVE